MTAAKLRLARAMRGQVPPVTLGAIAAHATAPAPPDAARATLVRRRQRPEVDSHSVASPRAAASRRPAG